MNQLQGMPLPLGVTVTEERMNFSVAVSGECTCELCLYEKGAEDPYAVLEMKPNPMSGNVRCLALERTKKAQAYLYRIDGEPWMDPRAKAIAEEGEQKRALITSDDYDWQGDVPLQIPAHQVIAYSLHVKGFTKHSSSKVRHKGTFRGLVEKLPYLKNLGINQIHCMPVYEFKSTLGKGRTNYWGYGPGYYFAPKASYAAGSDPCKELKDMVRSCHNAGIEVILEMPFADGEDRQMMTDCLRYYRMEYHVDGFILNPVLLPADEISRDPILSQTKILVHDNEFQNVMRRFLKGDEGTVGEVMYWLNHHTNHNYNYITNQNGFTLNDLVSYDRKHNEENGENNQDGPEYNYSWNCGAEGVSRKKSVTELRKNQMCNALFLLFTAQGTPCLLAGDEFANTQNGNNNIYCQDNPTGWLDWSRAKRYEWLTELVKDLIRFRKEHPVLGQPKPLLGADQVKCGIPDLSFHGEQAWRIPDEVSSRQLGMYCSGLALKEMDCLVIYNMHWVEHTFALPALPGKKKWHLAASTQEGVLSEGVELEDQHDISVKCRTVLILVGR